MKKRNKRIFSMLLSGMTALTLMTGSGAISIMAETTAEESAAENTDDTKTEETAEDAAEENKEETDAESDTTDKEDETAETDADASEADKTDDTKTDDEKTEDADAEETDAIDYEFENVTRPEYSALDYVKLGEYKGLTMDKTEVSVTDEEIETAMNQKVTTDDYEELSEGEVQSGDIANINYVGTMDGEEFDGGSADNYDLTIGSNSFIEGFEDGLIGVKIGETVDLDLTFPENYYEEMAGKAVTFKVTVNSVKRAPEMTDELAAKITEDECKDVKSLRESVEKELLETKEKEKLTEVKSSLLNQVMENSEISEYPEELIAFGTANYRNYYKMYAQYYGVTFEEFLTTYMGTTEEDFETTVRTNVENGFNEELYLGAIAETEKIEVTDEIFQEKAEELAKEYGFETAEEFITNYGEQEIRIVVRNNLVYDFLMEQAKEA
ncbi:MAG: trigger factor [Eubacteriales bacterium]|nr:trigger factor [Eubacteriales bacterium]